jgi:hypothetical protein
VWASDRDYAQIVKRLTVTALIVVSASLALLATSAAWGRTSQVALRIYDPSGQVKTEVTSADVVRSSVRASPGPGGAVLSFDLTKQGASKFHTLTRALARRGARLHRRQAFAVEIGGKVFSRPWIDYRVNPDGLPGDSGIEIDLSRLAVAQRLAKEILGG